MLLIFTVCDSFREVNFWKVDFSNSYKVDIFTLGKFDFSINLRYIRIHFIC